MFDVMVDKRKACLKCALLLGSKVTMLPFGSLKTVLPELSEAEDE